MIPPVLILAAFGRGPWLVPVPIPVLLLWPLAPLVIAHGRIARDPRGIALLRLAAAARGLRVSVRSGSGERFLLHVL